MEHRKVQKGPRQTQAVHEMGEREKGGCQKEDEEDHRESWMRSEGVAWTEQTVEGE